MLKLTHRKKALKGAFLLLGLFAAPVQAQSSQALEELGNLIDDAIFFTGKYVSPAADAVVYQAASGWVDSPQKKKLWDFTLGLHGNTFFVPQRDRQFTIANSDFKFFNIQNATTAVTPTALGNNKYVMLEGTLNNQQVTLRTPEGVNKEAITYPYLQGSLGLVYGTELIAKFSPRIYLKDVNYQIYGFGFKHNLSQYFKRLENNKIYLSALAVYTNEDLTVAFLNVQSGYGDLGINKLNSNINTGQFQLNASKVFKWFELSSGFIVNTSDFVYKVKGPKGSVEEIVPLQEVLNKKLESISSTKVNYIGEISGRFRFKKIYLQTLVAFGKFVNLNYSVQYEF